MSFGNRRPLNKVFITGAVFEAFTLLMDISLRIVNVEAIVSE